MELKIKGHSGCSVDIVCDNSELFVVKKTTDATYSERLMAQAKKQIKAKERCSDVFQVPQIYNVESSSDYTSITMEYIYSKCYVDFFETSGVKEIEHFTNSIIKYIEFELLNSTEILISKSIILNKWENVKLSISRNSKLHLNNHEIKDLIEFYNSLLKILPTEIQLPVGCCHGDLTFSNILFCGSQYYLIDFLDSFIESPLLDIVKIRQDTAFGWSNLMYTNHFDETRIKIISNFIDEIIDSYFDKYAWYQNFYLPFQYLNFFRILQYAKEPIIINYLIGILNKLKNEFYINSSSSRR